MTTTTSTTAASTNAPSSPLRIWWDACRPRTLPASAAPVVVGTALAAADGGARVVPAVLALVGALLLQITSNLANDLGDARSGVDGEGRLGPVRATSAGLVSSAAMKRAIAIVLGLAVAVGVGLVVVAGWPVVVIGLCSIACALAYTMGPWPLAYLGLGEVFVFVFFGPVAVAGTYFVQTGACPGHAIIGGIGPGLLAAAVLVVNNVRDHDVDARAHKRTLAVRFGVPAALALHALLVVGGAIAPIALWPALGPGALVPVATLRAAGRVHGDVREAVDAGDGRALNPLLGKTAQLLVLQAVLVVLAVIVRAVSLPVGGGAPR